MSHRTNKGNAMARFNWHNPNTISAREYKCGYCGREVAPNHGWFTQPTAAYVYVCHNCSCATFFDPAGKQFPGVPFGDPVQDVDEASVAELYEEARRTTAASCYTAAVLCCRKLLMHVAVSKGAAAGQSFVAYVEHLAANNFIPPDAKPWVDHIRKRSNEANHEIVLMKKEDAEELVTFTEMLLKVIYEFPAAMKKRAAGKPPQGKP
jgi:hypothetical protein